MGHVKILDTKQADHIKQQISPDIVQKEYSTNEKTDQETIDYYNTEYNNTPNQKNFLDVLTPFDI